MLFEFRGSFRARARRSMRHAGRRVPAESRRFGEYPPSHSIDDLRIRRIRDRTDELLQLALFFLRRNQSWLIVSRATPRPPPPLAPLSSHSPSVPLSASLSHGLLLTTCPTHATHGASTSRLGPRLPAAGSGRVPASPTSSASASASETAEISPLLLSLSRIAPPRPPRPPPLPPPRPLPLPPAPLPRRVRAAIRATVRPPAVVAGSLPRLFPPPLDGGPTAAVSSYLGSSLTMLSPGTFLRPIIPTVFLSMPGGASSPEDVRRDRVGLADQTLGGEAHLFHERLVEPEPRAVVLRLCLLRDARHGGAHRLRGGGVDVPGSRSTGKSPMTSSAKNDSLSERRSTPSPLFPARPVRPRRWMYVSRFAGTPTWITSVTSGKSMPRAVTPDIIITGDWRNRSVAFVRRDWLSLL